MLNLTASMAVAFKGLAMSDWRPKGTLVYLAVADEEALGDFGAKYLTENEYDAIRADFVITESGGIPIPSPAGMRLPVIVGEKGTYWCRLHVKGTPGHGSQPFRTDNALVKASEVVRRLGSYRPGRPHPRRVGAVHPIDGLPRRHHLASARRRVDGRVARDSSGGHGPTVPRVHAHDVRADDDRGWQQDQRDPRSRHAQRRRPYPPGADRRGGAGALGRRVGRSPRCGHDRSGEGRTVERVTDRHTACGTR